MSAGAGRATVVYDDTCSLCRAVADWIRARDVDGALALVPCRSPDLARRLPGVAREDCERALVVALPDGTRRAGAEALPEILALLPRWRRVAPALRWPPLRPLAARLYRWIAARRPRDAPESTRNP